MDARNALKEIVAANSLLTRPGGYTLASGQWSPYYFDLKAEDIHVEVLRLLDVDNVLQHESKSGADGHETTLRPTLPGAAQDVRSAAVRLPAWERHPLFVTFSPFT